MYITEIRESDFRKLDLLAYEHTKLKYEDGSWKWTYVGKKINDVLDEELKGAGDVKTIAFFLVDPPCEFGSENFTSAMFDRIPFDKFYWREGNSYNVWDDVNKIYSKKNYWFIDANSEFGRLRKAGIDRIYLVHLGE